VQPGIRPGFPAGAAVPAVRHAPPKKYQAFALEAPVKSSLNVIGPALLGLAARAPSKKSSATEKYEVFI
jgi:hypothetical protein